VTHSSMSRIENTASGQDTPLVSRRTRRVRPQDVDRLVGARIRARRIMLGMTLQQLAEAIGVTYQQANKYERGTNRVAAGRLAAIAAALGAPVSSFFEDLERTPSSPPTGEQRMLLELARNFLALPTRRHQESICAIVRALAEPPGAIDEQTAEGSGPSVPTGGKPRTRSGREVPEAAPALA
jgi:transcriptional regulator with XRE-family HTH domain